MKCALCGKKLSFLNAFRCSVCGQFFCEEHRLPESHGCKKERTPAVMSGKPPEKEQSLSKMKIRAPFLFEESKITIPKLLFPYNEDYLKYALFETLEKLQAQALLEPEVIGRRLRPDLIWLDRNIILECENFYKGTGRISEIVSHAYKYEQELGMASFVVLWKSTITTQNEEIYRKYGDWDKISDRIVQVDPITGEIEASDVFFKGKFEPLYDISLQYGTPGSFEFHSRMQYELAVWLWKRNEHVSFEIPISYSKHKVYAPDKLVISNKYGIVQWEPHGWWSYAIDMAPPGVTVDVISMDKNGIIKGYEVKSARDLRGGKLLYERTVRELCGMMLSKLFNQVFIVLPSYAAVPFAEEIEKAKDPATRNLGVIAHTGPYEFKIVKESEIAENVKREYLSIELADA